MRKKVESMSKHFEPHDMYSDAPLQLCPIKVFYLTGDIKLGRVLLYEAGKHRHEVYISPTGKSIRVVKIGGILDRPRVP